VIHIVDLIYHLTDQSFSVDPASPDPIVLDPGPGAYYYVARFSPDGQWLVLSRSDWQPDGKYNYHCSIRLAKADGTLIDGSVDKLLSDDYGYPAWSPDGSQLAFFRKPNLYIAELGTDSAGVPYVKSTRQLTKNGPNASWWDFSWSPDGTQIVFNYTAIGKVFVNGAEYGVPNGTSYGLAYGQCPDWSPMDLPRLP
jgi:Tol biopolymer transport system component